MYLNALMPAILDMTSKEHTLARDNYSYQKYRRELAKKKKKEEKLQRKLDKKKDGSGKIP